MKKITMLALLIFTLNASAQWAKTNLPSIGAVGELRTLFFINDNVGFVGGNTNTTEPVPVLYKTLDGGVSWTSINITSPNFSIINSIFFTDINNGFITTDNPNISYRTTDGGNTLTQVYCQSNRVGKVYFKNSSIGFYYSGNSWADNFSYTTNGGSTWTAYTTSSFVGAYFAGNISSIHFPSSTSNVGYLMNRSGDIFKTINNGLTWSLVSSGPSTNAYLSLHFLDELVGFRISSGTTGGIEKTLDGGLTWNSVSQISGNKILFSDATTCYISGLSADYINDSNEIYKATYQSASLTPLTFSLMTGTNTPIGIPNNIIDMQFPSVNTGYAIATNQYLYKIDTKLGVNKNEKLKTNVYPNPANNALNIEGLNVEGKKYSIYDIYGKQVENGIIKNNQVEVNKLQSGIYLLKIEGDFKEIKFIKE